MTGIASAPEHVSGPLADSIRVGFRTLSLAVALLAAAWSVSNMREIGPDSRAVVLRFGRVDRVRGAGLLFAWPRPVEEVRLLPASDQPIALKIQRLAATFASNETDVQFTPNDDIIHLQSDKDRANSTYLTTGDGSVVQLDATLFYEITDPASYLLVADRVEAALQRLYRSSAVAVAAGRDLDAFLVARPDEATAALADPGRKGQLSAARDALRGDLVRRVNEMLLVLRRSGSDLGVTVGRIDVVAVLPPVAKRAFDQVLTASQLAEQEQAAARTDATRTRQEAERARDRLVAESTAAADERVHAATVDTAGIAALETQAAADGSDTLLSRYYHEQAAAILRKAGEVTTIDVRDGQRLILPGASQ